MDSKKSLRKVLTNILVSILISVHIAGSDVVLNNEPPRAAYPDHIINIYLWEVKLDTVNPLPSKRSIKPGLISGFCSIKWIWVFDSTWTGLKVIHRRLAPSRHWYSFTYPTRMESWVSLGKKEVAQIFKSRLFQGSNWGPCGPSGCIDLTNCSNQE